MRAADVWVAGTRRPEQHRRPDRKDGHRTPQGDDRMGALLGLSRAIDAISTFIGRWIAWLVLVAVLVSAGNAIIRKVFGTSSNAWLELQWYLFGAVFMLCAAWTLLSNEHIRIDIISNMLKKRSRDMIDVIGHALFLLPFAGLMVYLSWPFVMRSIANQEVSTNAGGLIVWPAKALILLGFMMLVAQGISELIKRIAIMRGLIPDVHAAGGHHAAAEAEAQRLLEATQDEAGKR
jgi:TRAP-type mannitol/chloroaromatic compound transport system permease small subunit